MNITKTLDGKKRTLFVEGRLDNNSSSVFLSEFGRAVEDADEVALDRTGLDYLSSAGLRALLSAQKIMNKQGGALRIVNVTPDIMEIFELTGFTNVLNGE